MRKAIGLSVILFIVFSANGNSGDVSELKIRLREAKGTERVDILIQLAERTGNESLALEYGKQALDTAGKLKYKKGVARAAFRIGRIHLDKEEFDSALSHFTVCLETSIKLKDLPLTAQCEIEIGLIYFHKPDIDSAVLHFRKALEISSGLRDHSGMAVAYYHLGRSFRRSGKLETALEYSLKSLDFMPENNHNALNTISIIYAIMGDPEKAFEYQAEALKIRESLGLADKIIGSLNNLSMISFRRGMPQDGLRYLMKSLQKAEETGKKTLISRALNNIGYVYDEKFHKHEEALVFFKRSLIISEKVGENFEIANTLINIGNVQMKLDQPEIALENLNKGLALAQKIKADELIKNGFLSIHQYYEKQKDFKKALKNYKSFIAARDVIQTQQLDTKLTELKVRHQSEKKKRENELLKLQVEKGKLLRMGLMIISAGLFAFFLGLSFLFLKKNRLNKALRNEVSHRKKVEAELETLVKERTQKLQKEISARSELEHFHDITIDREFRMNELKEQIARLQDQIKELKQK